MQPIIMQPWLTVRGNGVTIIQDASEWIRSAPFQDMFFSVDVREITGAVTLAIETAPARDEPLFQPAVSAFTPLVGNNFKQVLMSNAAINAPISEWVRWKVVIPVGATNDITFRIVAHGNRFC
jgi:hypothetical protein